MGEIVSQINGRIMISADVSVKNIIYVEKTMFGLLLHVIVNDSAIVYDEVIESHDEEISFNEKKAICKTQNFYILHAFLLTTIALLTAVNIYCYLINYQGKQ